MAHVAILCMWVWHCPFCDTHLKARGVRTALSSAEYHMHRAHYPSRAGAPSSWDQSVEQEHWTFHIRPSGEPEPVSTLV